MATDCFKLFNDKDPFDSKAVMNDPKLAACNGLPLFTVTLWYTTVLPDNESNIEATQLTVKFSACSPAGSTVEPKVTSLLETTVTCMPLEATYENWYVSGRSASYH